MSVVFNPGMAKLHTNPETHPLFVAELKYKIFSYFPVASVDASRMARVCKSWNATSKDFHLAEEQFKEIRSLKLTDIKSWQQLCLNRYSKKLSEREFLCYCPRLEYLDLSHSSITDDGLLRISQCNFPSLKKLNLEACPSLLSPNFDHFTQLETLILTGCVQLTFPQLKGLASLKSLDLLHCPKLEMKEEDLQPLRSRLPKLEVINIDFEEYAHAILPEYFISWGLDWGLSQI
jgi:hypothetical protein